MNTNYIALSSITYANKAKAYLQTFGIKSHVVKTPADLSSCGCGYSIKVDADPDPIVDKLVAADIKVISVYTRN